MKKILLAIMIIPLLFTSCEECDCGVNGATIIDYSPLEGKAQIMKTAFENKDVDTMLELFTDDMEWVFPNGEKFEGKEEAKQGFNYVFSLWDEMKMDSGGDEEPPIILATSGEQGQFLMRWSPYSYKSFSGEEYTIRNHSVLWFNGDGMIKGAYNYYDRKEISKAYEDDPIDEIED